MPFGTFTVYIDGNQIGGELLLNVKDYGAIGDVVADDTAAIQAAVNALEALGGGVLHFPRGHYKITNTIRFRRGITVTCDGTGDVTATAAPIAPTTTLEWYGPTTVGTAMVEIRAATSGDTVYSLTWNGPALLGRGLAWRGLYARSVEV